MRIEIHSNGKLRYIIEAKDINVSSLPIDDRAEWRTRILNNKHGAMINAVKQELVNPQVFIILPSKINEL